MNTEQNEPRSLMKIFPVLWDIKSYDGLSIQSVWSKRELAETERERLIKDDDWYDDESLTIGEWNVDDPDGIEDSAIT